MKRRLIAIIVIILIVLGVIIIRNNINKSKNEYEIAKVDVYNYVKFREKDKYGVIDRSGNTIIPAEYKKIDIPNPSKDVFLCYKEDSEIAEVLNSKNEAIITGYDKVEAIKIKNIASTLSFEKSVLKYQKNGLYGLVDFSGKEITKNIYNSIENLQGTEGKFQVEKDGKNGVINLKGATLVNCEYDNVATDGYFSEETKYAQAGFIVSNKTEEGYRYGYIDLAGKKQLNVEYNEVTRINAKEEVYLIASKNGKYGLYKEAKQIIKPEYQSIIYTDNGAIIIEKNINYGIADLNGKILVEPKYTKFEEKGIYLYMQTERDNDVYDTNGKKIEINFNKSVFNTENEKYKITTILNNDITYYGVENNNGRELIESKYRYIEYICGDYFIVQDKKEKYGVIDVSGEEKIKIEYDLLQKIKDKNIVEAQRLNSNKVEVFSSDMELVTKMKNARVQNQNNYIKVYNSKESIYLDKEGNKIEESAEIVQNELKTQLPDKIGEYKKVQYSLEDVYYEK